MLSERRLAQMVEELPTSSALDSSEDQPNSGAAPQRSSGLVGKKEVMHIQPCACTLCIPTQQGLVVDVQLHPPRPRNHFSFKVGELRGLVSRLCTAEFLLCTFHS